MYYRVHRLVRSGVGVLGEGLDVRSARGLAVTVPTPGYSILVDAPIADAPAELVRRCPRMRRSRTVAAAGRLPLEGLKAHAALEHATARILEAGEGERHARLYGQARHCFDTTLDPRADAVLLGAALETGLPEHEALRTIADARHAAGGLRRR